MRRAPASRPSAAALLRAAERLRDVFGPQAARRKRGLLPRLARARFGPAELLRYHELLCFWRAYPDDRGVLRGVERALGSFARRRDLREHASRLVNSGVAGAAIRFRFFAPMAEWLARRWPRRLSIDWDEFEHAPRLATWLPLLAHPAELPALDEYDLSPREWIRRMTGPRETDAAFLVRRWGALAMSAEARHALYDELDPPLRLAPGPGGPSRTHARIRPRRTSWTRGPLSRERASPEEIARLEPRSVRSVSPREAERLLDRAREAMVTRSRDLDAFSYGDPRDVRRVEFDDGLEFACVGTLPARRLLLESVYGYLTLKNGVPVGYVLTASLFGSAEIAYNVFETFRGAEAAPIFARVLAMTRRLFGAGSFTIVPYQLGEGNEEAVGSGAWWFYQKMGFRPRDRAARALMRRELDRMRGRPGLRSSERTLRLLARSPLYLDLGPARRDVLGEIPLAGAGLAVGRMLARRFGAGRSRGLEACAGEAAEILRASSFRRWRAAEREAWSRWAPLVLALPGIRRWSPAEKRDLIQVIRAKGGRRESDYVRLFDAHPRLPGAISALARREG